MCEVTSQQWSDAAAVVASQIRETIQQDKEGVTIRLATITCPCGWKRAVLKMHHCLYCKVWFCHQCAEVHFGQTVAEYRAEHPVRTEYTTTPAESLAGIAIRELGSENRWKEIRDLNAEQFPAMGPNDYYPVGTIIMLPAAEDTTEKTL